MYPLREGVYHGYTPLVIILKCTQVGYIYTYMEIKLYAVCFRGATYTPANMVHQVLFTVCRMCTPPDTSASIDKSVHLDMGVPAPGMCTHCN